MRPSSPPAAAASTSRRPLRRASAELHLELQDGAGGAPRAREHDGDVLCFLPGAAEINRVQRNLETAGLDPMSACCRCTAISPASAQDAALAPAAPGQRKVVLATSIAETSLTIEGIRVVVDAGLRAMRNSIPRRA
jgi:ATP-dependent helicase HrpB